MFFCWAYIILNAFSALLRQYMGSQLSPALTLLIGSMIAILYFNLVNVLHLKRLYRVAYAYKKDWLILGVLIAMIWICAIYVPVYISASLYVILFFGILGECGLISTCLKKPSKILKFSIVGIMILLISSLVSSVMVGVSYEKIIGLTLVCMGGIAGFGYVKYSHSFMQKTGLKSTEVLAIRFYPTLLISMLLTPVGHSHSLSLFSMALAVLVGFSCLILPIYLSQKGIEQGGPETFAIISSFMPLVTGIFQDLILSPVATHSFIIYAVYGLFASFPYLVKRFKIFF